MTMATTTRIPITVNGTGHGFELDGDTRLLDVLRDELKLKGTRFGCGENQCGACLVLVDGFAVASCDTPLWALAGKQVTTVEGLGSRAAPHRLQRAFIAEQAGQCGYCSSGMLIAAAALLERCPHPTDAQIREALDRNLCRCGSHNRIVRAVLRAASSS